MRKLAINLLRRFALPAAGAPEGRVPPDCRVYAIGDIHGRCDLLNALHNKIRADIASANPVGRMYLIYIGDYVDRGPDSRGVLESLLAAPLPECQTVALRGNHDQIFLDFLEDARHGPRWFGIGGLATAESYGANPRKTALAPVEFEDLRAHLNRLVPESHRVFLRGLALHFTLGDYFFVHAGLRPGLPIARQDPHDMIWIRNRFLLSRRRHEKIVVHGHNRFGEPDLRFNRIGIDTGAYATGRLTCLVLENGDIRFLATD